MRPFRIRIISVPRPRAIRRIYALARLLVCFVVGAGPGLFSSPLLAQPLSQPFGTFSSEVSSKPDASDTFPRYRLRLTWRAEAATQWTGQVRVDRGRLTQLGRLDDELDALPDAHIEASELRVHQRAAAREWSVNITVQAPPDARLEIDLAPDASGASSQPTLSAEIPLAEVLASAVRRPLGGAGGMLKVERVAADKLRIDSDHSSLIFAPGESFTFDVEAALIGLSAGSPVDLSVELRDPRGEKPRWSAPPERKSAPVAGSIEASFAVPLPVQEGVYSVRLAAIQPPGSVKQWLPGSTGKVLAEREFQVVVFDPQRSLSTPTGWREIEAIDPTSKHWWHRLPKWAWLGRAPWLPEGPLGSSPAKIVSAATGRLVQLPPAGDGAPSWQAYPLPVKSSGKPYLIEVEYPTNAPQQLVLTVMDKNRHGGASPLGDSLHVAVTGSASSAGGMRTVRRIVWPKSQSPLLVLSNSSPDQPARFGRIRLLSVGETEQVQIAEGASGRRLALVATPNLPASLGATLATADGAADWQSWYEVSERLADWLALSGFDGAAVTVESAAGVIYPSQVLAPNDQDAPSDATNAVLDLPSDDGLELLLRQFDRRGLKLTPILSFESLSPQVERYRAELASANGQPATGYSPLDPEVRRATIAAVEEIANRYGHHPALSGVALRLSDRSSLVLPPPTAGLSEELFGRFLRETELQWPTTAARDLPTFRAAIEGPWGAAWSAWRTGQTTRLIESLADVLRRDDSDRQLLILPHDWLLSPRAEPQLIPRLDRDPDCDAALLAAGIDREALTTIGCVMLIEPRYQTGHAPLAAEAGRLMVNAGFAGRSTSASGVGVISASRKDRLVSFEQASPFGVSQTDATLRIVTHSDQAISGLSSVVAAGAPAVLIDGGDTLPLVVDDSLRAVREAVSQAPPRSEADQLVVQEPIVVRKSTGGDGAVIVITNPSPWLVEANVTLRLGAACTARRLASGDSTSDRAAQTSQQFGAGEHALPISLPPYAQEVLQFNSAAVEPVGVRLRVADGARAELAEQIATLRRRNLSARSRYEACPNPSFEQVDPDGRVAGWEAVGVGPRSTVVLTGENAAEGAQAMRLTSAGATAGMQSNPFATPHTGQLALWLRVRAQRLAPNTQLAITFEQIDGGYRSFTTISAERLGAAGQSSGGSDWQSFIFSVDDLPVAVDHSMRVRFDLQGAGQIDVDHLDFYDLVFPLEFLGSESAKDKLALMRTIYAAESALEAGRLNTCREMLAGYWPRFLDAYTPLSDAPSEAEPLRTATRNATEGPPSKREAAPPAPPKEKPGIGERLKGYLPSFMRF